METLIRKLTDARIKQQILLYLRYYNLKRFNALDLRNELFGEPFDYQKVVKSFETLVKDGVVNCPIIKGEKDPQIIWYNDDSFDFIESGGYVKKFFDDEQLEVESKSFTQAHQKDLILSRMIYAGQGSWSIKNLSSLLFTKYEDEKMRNYSDEFSEDGLVEQGSSNAHIQYKRKAIEFIEGGGYTGQYLLKLKLQAEKESEITLKINQEKKKISDRKEYIENFNTTIKYYALKYGIWIVIALLCIVFIMTILGFIPQKQAIQGFNWVISFFR